jgi:hypothetical protein
MSNSSKKEEREEQVIKPVAYIGPTVQGIVIRGTIFSNGLPKALKEEIRDKPFLNSLIIPINNLTTAQAELRKENSPINIFYKKAIEYVNEGGRK